jgi:hypothetical protein
MCFATKPIIKKEHNLVLYLPISVNKQNVPPQKTKIFSTTDSFAAPLVIAS